MARASHNTSPALSRARARFARAQARVAQAQAELYEAQAELDEAQATLAGLDGAARAPSHVPPPRMSPPMDPEEAEAWAQRTAQFNRM